MQNNKNELQKTAKKQLKTLKKGFLSKNIFV